MRGLGVMEKQEVTDKNLGSCYQVDPLVRKKSHWLVLSVTDQNKSSDYFLRPLSVGCFPDVVHVQ